MKNEKIKIQVAKSSAYDVKMTVFLSDYELLLLILRYEEGVNSVKVRSRSEHKAEVH